LKSGAKIRHIGGAGAAATFGNVRHLLKACLLSCLLLPAFCASAQYTNLALEGGGIRGIAYTGAFEVLEARGITDSIRNIAGTSVGAVAGSLLAVGYSAQEIKELMASLHIQTFNDGRWFFIGGQHRMRKLYGWYRGDALEAWIEDCLALKTGARHLTFRQLHSLALSNRRFKDLFLAASNLSRQRLVVFSWQTFPEMEVATAVRASMSVPLYFEAVCLDSLGRKTAGGDVYVDGGLVMNYPLGLFDSGSVNIHTLGLKLERPEQIEWFKKDIGIAPYEIQNFRSYVAALYNLTIETLNRKTPMSDEFFRTIYISTEGIHPRVRKMSRAQKEILYRSGQKAAQQFFSR
jgi:NTE family protein